jgi:hypothetical protein
MRMVLILWNIQVTLKYKWEKEGRPKYEGQKLIVL